MTISRPAGRVFDLRMQIIIIIILASLLLSSIELAALAEDKNIR